jgi:hypothetical protein
LLLKSQIHLYAIEGLQGWAIPGFGQQYYTQYSTRQKYAKLYNTLYQYYTKSKWQILSVKQQHTVIV